MKSCRKEQDNQSGRRQSKPSQRLSDMMKNPFKIAIYLIVLCLFAISGASADEPGKPEITPQGFSSQLPVEGVIGKYPRTRVRIEAPGRISELIIKERSYEVNLASTRDKPNLSLFGLEQSPRSRIDVTLNLQNYINERIETEGEYEFQILAADKSGNRVETTIILKANLETTEAEILAAREARLLRNGDFTFQRTGADPVEGARQFGLDWQNIDNANVAIRISKLEGGAPGVVILDESDFDSLETVDQLAQRVANLEKAEAIVLVAGGNKAAGKIFAVVHDEKPYLFKILSSSAYPSDRGTVVTLNGVFKTGQMIGVQ